MGIRSSVKRSTLAEANVLDLLIPEPAAIYVMDRAYLDFERLFGLHQAGAFFVTRAKSNTDLRRVYSAPSDRAQGIVCDRTVTLSGFYSHAVKSQIWVAISVYVLVAIIKKRLDLDVSLYTLLQVFSVTLFEKMPLNKGFFETKYTSERSMNSNQLNLFDY